MAVEPIELHTSAQAAQHPSPTGSSCACGHEDESEIVLDTRTIPHAIRHATIFGALGAIAPSFSLDLVANHNPLPLIAQLEAKQPGDFTVTYLSDGPDEWKLRFTRS
ncbi:DUF2249 domain-containing protein [Homoserinimonas sp. A447]